MSRSVSGLRIGLAVVFVAAGVAVCAGQSASRQPARPIEFSSPRSDEVTTNLHQLTSRKDGLRQLEEDLYAPLQKSLGPRNSLEGVMAPLPKPPAPSAVQNRRVKELLERRKNWMFMAPEDLLASPTVDKVLKSPEYGGDWQDRKELTPLEAYYQRMMPKRPAKKPTLETEEILFSTSKKSGTAPFGSDRDETELPRGVLESAETLKSLIGKNDSPFPEADQPASYDDPFRLGIKPPTQEQVAERKKLMDQYRALLQPTRSAPTVNPSPGLPTLAEASSSAATPPTGLPAASGSAPRRGLEAQLDIVDPLLGPTPLPDVNARAVGQTRPGLPKVQARRVIPTPPDFAAPRRAF